ncbi:Nitrate/nitrite response regulator protein NarL [Erwinia aphidicola]|uniref:LuxR C-terminal-related transcriptional regulator n=1 Tax=Erwinia aphidicola TaxID=68334 RepID=UPI001D38B00F|nr:LuxR C-terminal-related transcriptional regulator [Erwinia aphidicola]CAH0203352.1 Nitrate/nitrite response regulator protein NarL [Erwinia aphidicola]
MEDHDFSVLIIESHPLVRYGLHSLLAQDPRFKLIVEAKSGAEGVSRARSLRPTLILLEREISDMPYPDAISALRGASADSQIAVLINQQCADFSALMTSGVQGVILKRTETEPLLAEIVKVALGGKAWSAALQGVYGAAVQQADRLSILTGREREVLREVASGLANRQIADCLAISEQTVKVHIRNVLRKLNVHSRVAATVLWLSSPHANL